MSCHSAFMQSLIEYSSRDSRLVNILDSNSVVQGIYCLSQFYGMEKAVGHASSAFIQVTGKP